MRLDQVVTTTVKRWVLGRRDDEERIVEDERMLSKLFQIVTTTNVKVHGDEEQATSPQATGIWQRLIHLTFDDTRTPFYLWSGVVTMACVYNWISIGMLIFEDFFEHWYWHWIFGNLLSDAVNLVDIAAQSKREFLLDGIPIREPQEIRKHYFKSKSFLFDVLSVLPTDLLLLWQPRISVVRLNRLLKTYRYSDFMQRTEIHTHHPYAFHMFRLFTICYVLFHWNGCVYFLLSILYDYQNAIGDDWVFAFSKIPDVLYPVCDARIDEGCLFDETHYDFHYRHDYVDELNRFWSGRFNATSFSNLTKKYSLSFYWSALTLVTLGEQPWPRNKGQMVYEIFDTMLGLMVFAFILGDIGTMVTGMNLTRSIFQEILDGCKQFMEFRKVGKFFEGRVINWFEYVWMEGHRIEEKRIAESLPSRLYGQLMAHIHMDTLRRVTLFQDCDLGLLVEIVQCLQLQIFSPGDIVCHKGDIGKEMYIVKRGILDVVNEETGEVFCELAEGSVFGEISVLNIPGNKNRNRRTATIRCLSYADLYVLSKSDLWNILHDYPYERDKLVAKAKEILRRDGLLDESTSEAWKDSGVGYNVPIEEQLYVIRESIVQFTRDLDAFEKYFIKTSNELKQAVTTLERTYATIKEPLKRLYRKRQVTLQLRRTRQRSLPAEHSKQLFTRVHH
ncbi:Protein CNG-1 b [Aphelenchoides avenae]|nr:Protein CNG-1 b [Aphelenchus avenae]